MKLTRKLRNQLETEARYCRSGGEGAELAAKIRALDVEDEPVTWKEALEAAKSAGWQLLVGSTIPAHFIRGAEHFEVVVAHLNLGKPSIVTDTCYAPRDLLDGRLAALDCVEGKPC